jgi:hypothetical protein
LSKGWSAATESNTAGRAASGKGSGNETSRNATSGRGVETYRLSGEYRERLTAVLGDYIDVDSVKFELHDTLPTADLGDAADAIMADEKTIHLRRGFVNNNNSDDVVGVLAHELTHVIQARKIGLEAFNKLCEIEARSLDPTGETMNRYSMKTLQDGLPSPSLRIYKQSVVQLAKQNFLSGNYTIEQIATRVQYIAEGH